MSKFSNLEESTTLFYTTWLCDTFQEPTTLRLVLKKHCNFVRDNLSASVGSSDEELYVYSITTIVISLLKILYQIQYN